ncbi:MAG: alpha/beta fold hydrolase [Solirubrobacterales bacterium]|nr:alpha/beta fold hydrolase [Solirubrobacterales bacterium]
MKQKVRDVIARHEAAGRRFEAAGVGSFVLEQGDGDPVVLMHGVPVSCFLYRKVVPELAARGLRGVAFDLPGLGLAERPEGFDYSWSGLASWTGAAIDALGIERCHLVVHDIGGPVGFEWAIRNPERVLSLTALNTLVDAATFRRPWSMHPFSIRGVGEVWLRGTPKFLFSEIFYLQGVKDRAAAPRAEVYAHQALLRREDNGRAFLRIMRGFELTEQKERFFFDGLAGRDYPAQVVWGRDDPALGERRRQAVQRALGVEQPTLLPAKHFLQEDQAPAVAEAIASSTQAGRRA